MFKKVAAVTVVIGVLCWFLWPKVSPLTERNTGVSQNTVANETTKRMESSLREVAPVEARVTQTPKRIPIERRRELLRAFLAARSAHPVSQRSEIEPPVQTKLTTRQYIKEQIDGIQPLVAECFRKAKKIDPSLSPQLPVSFTIGGEPGVGGIVTEAELHPQFAKQQALADCVKETLFSLEIDPPEGDGAGGVGEVNVRYSFDFEDDDA